MEQAVSDAIRQAAAQSHVLMLRAIEAELELERKRKDRTTHADAMFDAAQDYRRAEKELAEARSREWELHKRIISEHGMEAYAEPTANEEQSEERLPSYTDHDPGSYCDRVHPEQDHGQWMHQDWHSHGS